MNILDIAIAKKLAGGGGGSGTDNYNDLSNLPKINDTTLSGNKSSSALGLQSEINSDSKLASDLVDDTNQDNKFVTSTEKNTWNGKQNAIDADHKLSSDLVDDANKTNKFVTSTEKNTWNAKQNAIDSDHKLSSDLVDDANKTNKFVTSTEKNTWNAKQNAIDADHKLSSSLVSFTEAEAAALASGIDSSKVGQISTNQTNIWLVDEMHGGRNECEYNQNMPAWSGITITVASDSVKMSGTTSSAYTGFIYDGAKTSQGTLTNLTEDYICVLFGTATGVNINLQWMDATGTYHYDNLASPKTIPAGARKIDGVYIQKQTTTSVTVSVDVNIMLCKKRYYDAGFTDFQPYALPNYDLTRLEAEDRAALAEEIDAGAKNLLDTPTVTVSDITFTADSEHYITASPNNGDGRLYTYANCQYKLHLKKGTYILALEIKTSTSSNNANVLVINTSNTEVATIPNWEVQNKTGLVYREFTISTEADYGVLMKCYTMAARLMICTKAAFGVSNKFVPYRPNYDLVCQNIKDVNTVLEAVL